MNKRRKALFCRLIDDTCDKVLLSFIKILNDKIRICREEFIKRNIVRSTSYIYAVDNIFKEQLIEFVDRIVNDIQDIPSKIHVDFFEPEMKLIQKQVVNKISDLGTKYIFIKRSEIKRVGFSEEFGIEDVKKIISEVYKYIAVCFKKTLSINKSKRPSVDIKFRRAELWISVIAILIAIVSLVVTLNK